MISKKPAAKFSMHMSLVDSCNGMLCMRDSRSIYICNPFTRVSLELPKLINYPAQLGHLEFGFHQPQKITSSVWRYLGMITNLFLWQVSKVMVNGRLHWLSRPNKYRWAGLISFDLATEQFQEIPKPNCCRLDWCFQHLMVLRACVSAYDHNNKELEFWVMKEYGKKESWVKKFTIGTCPRQYCSKDWFP
ncbi:hypothetical protein DITRI_Ditri11bG0044500 [Diplodiscus trichospermus]